MEFHQWPPQPAQHRGGAGRGNSVSQGAGQDRHPHSVHDKMAMLRVIDEYLDFWDCRKQTQQIPGERYGPPNNNEGGMRVRWRKKVGLQCVGTGDVLKLRPTRIASGGLGVGSRLQALQRKGQETGGHLSRYGGLRVDPAAQGAYPLARVIGLGGGAMAAGPPLTQIQPGSGDTGALANMHGYPYGQGESATPCDRLLRHNRGKSQWWQPLA